MITLDNPDIITHVIYSLIRCIIYITLCVFIRLSGSVMKNLKQSSHSLKKSLHRNNPNNPNNSGYLNPKYKNNPKYLENLKYLKNVTPNMSNGKVSNYNHKKRGKNSTQYGKNRHRRNNSLMPLKYTSPR